MHFPLVSIFLEIGVIIIMTIIRPHKSFVSDSSTLRPFSYFVREDQVHSMQMKVRMFALKEDVCKTEKTMK